MLLSSLNASVQNKIAFPGMSHVIYKLRIDMKSAAEIIFQRESIALQINLCVPRKFHYIYALVISMPCFSVSRQLYTIACLVFFSVTLFVAFPNSPDASNLGKGYRACSIYQLSSI